MSHISLQDVSNIILAIVGMLSVIVLIGQTTILRKQSKIMEKQTQITESQTRIMNTQTEISEFVAFLVEPVWAASALIVVNVKNEGTGVAREASLTWSIIKGNETLESGTKKMQPIGPSNKQNVDILLRYSRKGTTDAILRLSWSGKRADGQEFGDVYETYLSNMKQLASM